MSESLSQATIGGGCFWCLEAVFQRLSGVEKVVSGYAGGTVAAPSYQAVCTGSTGHAEVVQITFDPSQCSYLQLLEVFFKTHDPTTLNRQGNDVGTQYRSVIFYHDEQQRDIAEQLIRELGSGGAWPNPIVTEIAPLPTFYAAEAYHQDYFNQHPDQGYCQFVIAPKVDKFQQVFGDLAKLKTH